MPLIRFTATPKLPRDLAHLGYKKGDEREMTEDQATRWVRRNVAEYVSDEEVAARANAAAAAVRAAEQKKAADEKAAAEAARAKADADAKARAPQADSPGGADTVPAARPAQGRRA
ncbi:MAG: hypothetical protein AB7O45_00445 [Alphaproteobacteria bacterium]